MMIKKFGALLLSAVLCVGMAVPAFAYGGEPVEEVEQPVLTEEPSCLLNVLRMSAAPAR